MRIILVLILSATIINSCGQKFNNVKDTENHAHTNHLINETSPYLLQHAHNPVDWYPWGEEALNKAKEEKKLIIISIGYAACHWCHVMERESFEDSLVAKIMNDNFISIKVDREERPDIDQIYMEAAQLIKGSGGWPLNAIALPDGRPVFADTYFPKDNWISLLERIQEIYTNTPDKVILQAEQITAGINEIGLIPFNDEDQTHTSSDLDSIYHNWREIIDFRYGGQKGVQKFPLPVAIQYLLNYGHQSNNESAKEAALLTLDKMAMGGIYDHVGGGFARYSTDPVWKVPHFEKMLYDNGQLVSVYSFAYQMTKNPLYKEIVEETVEFIEREMTSSNGGFYSSLDADSEGEEGKFYIWTKAEIDNILKDHSSVFNAYFNVNDEGNWEEGQNVLYRTKPISEIASSLNLSEEELKSIIKESKKKLLVEREERVRPPLDDKILTGWNALMMKAYADAYRVFNDPRYLEKALNNAAFLKDNVIHEDYQLLRNHKDGKSSINAFLDDYALLIDAYIAMYQATFQESWLLEAGELTKYVLAHFYNEDNGMFYYTSIDDPALVARKMEIADNVIPGSNSVMAKNLYVLGEYLYKTDWVAISSQMLNNVKSDIIPNGPYYANWDNLLLWHINKPYEIAIVGPEAIEKRKEFDKNFLPNVFYMGGETEGSLPLLEHKLNEGETTIYVCRNKSCRLPVTTTEKALVQMVK